MYWQSSRTCKGPRNTLRKPLLLAFQTLKSSTIWQRYCKASVSGNRRKIGCASISSSRSPRQTAGSAEVGDEAMAAGDAVKAAALYRAALATNPDEALLSYKLAKALDKT